MDDDKIPIVFDDDNHIRVLEPEKFKETQQLAQESQTFIEKTSQFHEAVTILVDVLDKQSKDIESEKLKAIGQRNRVESEAESRKRKQQELSALINEKKAFLERLTVQLESLSRVESEQRALIEKLGNNEA
eukprot:GILI01015442.1.p1 GENE.GILI01015442.1~~GILI01015442.1.p1  ORF type:complete len:145 (+),score=21.42 GILI01015442.1:43-435(+)